MIETTRPDTPPVPTIVVSRPGMMQQSLRASLAACPSIAVVATFGDGLTTLNQLARLHPGLLVIDSNLLEEEVDALIAAVKVSQPAIRCLVFLKSTQQEMRMLAAGADAVTLRDVSTPQLQAILARLVQAARKPET
jgi:DNA-binding NarL/FixJ family response regulator